MIAQSARSSRTSSQPSCSQAAGFLSFAPVVRQPCPDANLRHHPRLPDPRRSGRPGACARGLQPPVPAPRRRRGAGAGAGGGGRPDGLRATTRCRRATSTACGWPSRTRRRWSPLLDDCDRFGRIAGAVNAVRRLPDGRVEGALFDGVGFVKALDHFGIEARGRTALVVGVGGGGVAIAASLAARGVSRLGLFDPSPRRAPLRWRSGCTPSSAPMRSRVPTPTRWASTSWSTRRRSACSATTRCRSTPPRLHAGAAVVDIVMKNQPTAAAARLPRARHHRAPRLRDAGAAGARIPFVLRLRQHRTRRARPTRANCARCSAPRDRRSIHSLRSHQETNDEPSHPHLTSPPARCSLRRRPGAGAEHDQARRCCRSCRAPAPPPGTNFKNGVDAGGQGDQRRRRHPRQEDRGHASPTRSRNPGVAKGLAHQGGRRRRVRGHRPHVLGLDHGQHGRDRTRRDPQLHRRRGGRDHASRATRTSSAPASRRTTAMPKVARYIASNLKAKTVAVHLRQQRLRQGRARFVRQGAEAAGLKVVADISTESGQVDFSAPVLQGQAEQRRRAVRLHQRRRVGARAARAAQAGRRPSRSSARPR